MAKDRLYLALNSGKVWSSTMGTTARNSGKIRYGKDEFARSSENIL